MYARGFRQSRSFLRTSYAYRTRARSISSFPRRKNGKNHDLRPPGTATRGRRRRSFSALIPKRKSLKRTSGTIPRSARTQGKKRTEEVKTRARSQDFRPVYLRGCEIVNHYRVRDVRVGANRPGGSITERRGGDLGKPLLAIKKFYGVWSLRPFTITALGRIRAPCISTEVKLDAHLSPAYGRKIQGYKGRRHDERDEIDGHRSVLQRLPACYHIILSARSHCTSSYGRWTTTRKTKSWKYDLLQAIYDSVGVKDEKLKVT